MGKSKHTTIQLQSKKEKADIHHFYEKFQTRSLDSSEVQKQVDLIQRLTWDRGQDFILIDKNKTLKEARENMLNNHNSDLKQKEK